MVAIWLTRDCKLFDNIWVSVVLDAERRREDMEEY
jgi:hypothetical protein